MPYTHTARHMDRRAPSRLEAGFPTTHQRTTVDRPPSTRMRAVLRHQRRLCNPHRPHGEQQQPADAEGGGVGAGRGGAAGEEQGQGEHGGTKPGKEGGEDGEHGVERHPCGVDDGVELGGADGEGEGGWEQ